jgi:hypothetical protein
MRENYAQNARVDKRVCGIRRGSLNHWAHGDPREEKKLALRRG